MTSTAAVKDLETELGSLNKKENIVQDSEEEDDRPPLPENESPWKVYLSPQWLSLIINKSKVLYGLIFGFYYLMQFIGAVAVINLYSDSMRLVPCAVTGDLENPEESSKVFDTAFLLLAIWHMIEWIRATVLLMVVFIGVRWAWFWYITMPCSIYGLVVYAIVHAIYLGDDGKACREYQEDRAAWLLAEIIAFWVTFFLFVYPFMWTVCRGKAKADEALAKAYADDEDEDD